MKEMLRDAGLDGFLTNYSLRWTAVMILCPTGQNIKFIKELTRHISNTMEKYETTSDEQHMQWSSIIQGEMIATKSKENVQNVSKVELIR